MMKAKLGKDQLAEVAGDITVFNYYEETREYFSTSVKFLPIGVGIPAHSCIDAPGEKRTGYAICRTVDLSAWEYVVDHRGETVYNIDTRVERVITTLGDYPSDTTPYAPTTAFDKWDGQQWVTDIAVQKQHEVQQAESQKRYLMSQASIAITPLQYAVDLQMETPEEQASLLAWKKYCVLLNRVDCSKAPDIDWPKAPE